MRKMASFNSFKQFKNAVIAGLHSLYLFKYTNKAVAREMVRGEE